jgi:competence protein ComEC
MPAKKPQTKKPAGKASGGARKKPFSKRRKKNNLPSVGAILVILIVIAAYLGLSALDYYNPDVDIDMGGFNIFEKLNGGDAPEVTVPAPSDGELMFHFIDVGQGDAILITGKEGNILIDTSESRAKEQLDSYLKSAGVEKIDFLVLTHTDADHIGNAEHVIRNYDVKEVLMPDFVATTATYLGVLDALEDKGIVPKLSKAGDQFELGTLKCILLAPLKDYDDANEMSLVIKAIYGDTSVMLTGDAEKESEGDMVDKWSDATLKCDILKVGHHGSTTSTTDAFLGAVAPKYAVISCGEDNRYGHPHDETIEKLEEMGVEIYRTDLHGTVVFKTDGKTFALFSKEK